jgi:hypothetical protein
LRQAPPLSQVSSRALKNGHGEAGSGSRTCICGMVSRRPNRWTIPAPLPTTLRSFESVRISGQGVGLTQWPCARSATGTSLLLRPAAAVRSARENGTPSATAPTPTGGYSAHAAGNRYANSHPNGTRTVAASKGPTATAGWKRIISWRSSSAGRPTISTTSRSCANATTSCSNAKHECGHKEPSASKPPLPWCWAVTIETTLWAAAMLDRRPEGGTRCTHA